MLFGSLGPGHRSDDSTATSGDTRDNRRNRDLRHRKRSFPFLTPLLSSVKTRSEICGFDCRDSLPSWCCSCPRATQETLVFFLNQLISDSLRLLLKDNDPLASNCIKLEARWLMDRCNCVEIHLNFTSSYLTQKDQKYSMCISTVSKGSGFNTV